MRDTCAAVVDGDKVIGQSIAMSTYIGKKVGLNAGVDEDKALQFMLDLEDVWTEYGKAATAGLPALKTFLQGAPSEDDRSSGRFALWLAHLEASIQGPFYFGEQMSYVDFQMASVMDLLCARSLNKLQEKTGDLLTPKVRAIHTAVKGLESAKNLPYSAMLPEGYLMTDEDAAAY